MPVVWSHPGYPLLGSRLSYSDEWRSPQRSENDRNYDGLLIDFRFRHRDLKISSYEHVSARLRYPKAATREDGLARDLRGESIRYERSYQPEVSFQSEMDIECEREGLIFTFASRAGNFPFSP